MAVIDTSGEGLESGWGRAASWIGVGPARRDRSRALRHVLAAAALWAGPVATACAGGFPQVPMGRVAAGPLAMAYATGPRAQVVVQVDGGGIAGAQGIDITLVSRFPTQVRVYLVRPGEPVRFRYVVFTRRALRRRLVLPVSAFDPDPGARTEKVPAGGALAVVDCPGFLRTRLANVLTVGPVRLLPAPPRVPEGEVPPPAAPDDPLYRRILGGWLGKLAGGQVGMPFEGRLEPLWDRRPELEKGLPAGTWGFGPDDDSSFMVQHLSVAEAKGAALGPADLVSSWVTTFAYEYLWKTERHALACIEKGILPPETGRGPLGESLCARIRADLWGLVCPGDPRAALGLVERDAPISNSGLGIADARFAAAAVSLAFGGGGVERLVEGALGAAFAPGTRGSGAAYRGSIERCLDDFRRGRPVQEAYARLRMAAFDPIHARDPDNSWAYALPNAGIVTLALLYGGGDFARTVALAASMALDADCNAATAGTILGVLGGEASIPPSFKEPFHDRLRATVAGQEHLSIRRVAWRTLAVARSMGASPAHTR